MSTISDQPRSPAAGALMQVPAPIHARATAYTVNNGPRGAYFVAGISVGLLFIGWLAFYFLLFMPRGSVG
jgi:hypothetical protein